MYQKVKKTRRLKIFLLEDNANSTYGNLCYVVKAMFKRKFRALNPYFIHEYLTKYCSKDSGSIEEKTINSVHGVQFGKYFVEK